MSVKKSILTFFCISYNIYADCVKMSKYYEMPEESEEISAWNLKLSERDVMYKSKIEEENSKRYD